MNAKTKQPVSHTPGPWSFVRCNCNQKGCSRFTIDTPFNIDGKFAEADIRLIAAAPELLDALKECITDSGATAERNHKYALMRLEVITKTAQKAIARVVGADNDKEGRE